MNFQVRSFIRENFKGLFLASGYSSYLPSLEKYSVDDISLFEKDSHLASSVIESIEERFYEPNSRVQIIFPNMDKEPNKVKFITMIKESPDNVKSQDSNIEFLNYSELVTSLTTPWTLINLLHLYWYQIASLKRKIYDFIKASSRPSILNKIYRTFSISKLVQLKYELAKYRVLFKRIEREFNTEALWLYSFLFDMKKYKTKQENTDQVNLSDYLVNRVQYPIANLDTEIKIINENFSAIEEINSFRTNYILQYISILLAFLAFIFGFDKAKDIIQRIIELIRQ